MTLIVSVLTQDYVVQVSDRRVTWIYPSGKLSHKDDNRNKSVFYCGRMAFAYAGLAEFQLAREKLPTDVWLTRVLSNPPKQPIDVAAANICREADKFYDSLPSSHKVPHFFVGVGWAIPSDESEVQPLFVEISNGRNEQGQVVNQANPNFSIIPGFLQLNDIARINVAGQAIPRRIYYTLRRRIRQSVRRQLSPKAVIDFIASAIRQVATNNPYVGSNLMALSIPRSSGQSASSSLSTFSLNHVVQEATFLYLPEGQDEGVNYWPNWVCDGAITGMRSIYGDKARQLARDLEEKNKRS